MYHLHTLRHMSYVYIYTSLTSQRNTSTIEAIFVYPEIKIKHTQFQNNNNNKIYNVTWVKVFNYLTDFSFFGKG
jgi:Fe-S cluster assembly scaffold protein SufB